MNRIEEMESLANKICKAEAGQEPNETNLAFRKTLVHGMNMWNQHIGSNLWTSPCICPPDEKTGETICCNHCGKPTARTSGELLGDDDAGVIAVNVASNVIPKLTTQEEAFFIAGFQECVKYLRTSPLLASKDARIRELEEANKLAHKLLKTH